MPGELTWKLPLSNTGLPGTLLDSDWFFQNVLYTARSFTQIPWENRLAEKAVISTPENADRQTPPALKQAEIRSELVSKTEEPAAIYPPRSTKPIRNATTTA